MTTVMKSLRPARREKGAASGPRVVIASRLFRPDPAAAAFRLAALSEGFSQARVRVLTTLPFLREEPGKREEPGAVEVRRFPVLRDEGGNVRGFVQYLSFDVPLAFRLLLTGYDVAVNEPPPTTGAVVAAVSWLKRRPFVYYAADIWSEALPAAGASDAVVKVGTMLEGFALRRAAAVLAVSEGVARAVRAYGVPAERVHVVGNGIDTELFTPAGPVPPGAAGRFFVYTGTMSEIHGAEVFIEALALLPAEHADVRLKFFGQGAGLEGLRALAERLVPGRVDFEPLVPPQVAAAWIRASVAALASIVPDRGYDFAVATKLYAAAACGTPVLFAGQGTSLEIVRDNALGEGVPYAAPAVGNAMVRLLEQSADGTSAARRAGRVEWVGRNASLRQAGRRAAAVVESVVREKMLRTSEVRRRRGR